MSAELWYSTFGGANSIAAVEDAIGYSFHDKTTLLEAFTHASAEITTMDTIHNNERLEFLGDAVLGLAASGALYSLDKKLSQGEMTEVLGKVVNMAACKMYVERLGIGNFMIVGNSFVSGGNVVSDSMLADLFEALVGAVHEDSGFDFAISSEFVLRVTNGFEVAISSVEVKELSENYKGRLQEYLKENVKYVSKKVSGSDHVPLFRSQAYVRNELIATGEGKPTKKQAEQAAAKSALEHLAHTSS